MAIYECLLCGYVYDEEKEGKPFSEVDQCPCCCAPAENLELQTEPGALAEQTSVIGGEKPAKAADIPDGPRAHSDYRHYADIREMAETGKPNIAAMGTTRQMPNWDDILILGNQLNPPPLDEHSPVDTTAVIGRNAKKPLVIDTPIYISHMSFGALSREAKHALAKGSAAVKTAMCSGEGGILPEEMAAAHRYIFEYVPNLYSVTPENLKNSDAIEIKIGQGTKPGMGGHLPGGKVTPEIAAIRNKPLGQDVISPSKFPDINSPDDLKRLVAKLRNESDGRPIGVKIAAGRVEADLAHCVYAEPDFITIDGRGGATGASPAIIRDATTIPTLFALTRAAAYLREHDPERKISLIITGGLRVSADFAKALALGADAVAIASAAMVALGCRQYRICGSGNCPTGIATQDPLLRKRFDVEKGAAQVANFLACATNELKTFARITGHARLADINRADLVTTSYDIAKFAGISYVGAPYRG